MTTWPDDDYKRDHYNERLRPAEALCAALLFAILAGALVYAWCWPTISAWIVRHAH